MIFPLPQNPGQNPGQLVRVPIPQATSTVIVMFLHYRCSSEYCPFMTFCMLFPSVSYPLLGMFSTHYRIVILPYHPSILSCTLMMLSYSRIIIVSCYRMIIWSYGHMAIWSYGHAIGETLEKNCVSVDRWIVGDHLKLILPKVQANRSFPRRVHGRSKFSKNSQTFDFCFVET